MNAGSVKIRETMLGLLSGYWYSQSLYVLAELGLADLLSRGPAGSRELAERCGADPDALFRFLRAMADVGLVSRIEEDLFATTAALGLLAEDHPASLRALARLGGHPVHWRAWGTLLQSLRGGSAQGDSFYEALRESPDLAGIFDRVMRSGAVLDDEILSALELPDRGRVVDIGGGSGRLLESLVERHPGLEGIVFDLRSVLDSRPAGNARARLDFVKGDFLDGVPGGGDAYLLKFVLHNWDDERAARILGNCRDAMGPGSRLFAVEVLLKHWPGSSHANRHDLNMMVLTAGRERSGPEYEALFAAAGLRLDRRIDLVAGPTILAASPLP